MPATASNSLSEHFATIHMIFMMPVSMAFRHVTMDSYFAPY